MAARNSSRTYLRRFLERAAGEVAPGALVLDAGAGRAQYRGLFAHARYETADFLAVKGKRYVQPDYVCDLAAIPVEDARFDHVICTQVLEHLPEPLCLCSRELRPRPEARRDALAQRTAVLRGARDARTTSSATRSSVCAGCSSTRGFEVLELAWLEGYFGTLSYQVRVALPGAARQAGAAYGGGLRGRGPRGRGAGRPPLGAPRRHGLAGLDEEHKVVDAGMPKNHAAVARKPIPGERIARASGACRRRSTPGRHRERPPGDPQTPPGRALDEAGPGAPRRLCRRVRRGLALAVALGVGWGTAALACAAVLALAAMAAVAAWARSRSLRIASPGPSTAAAARGRGTRSASASSAARRLETRARTSGSCSSGCASRGGPSASGAASCAASSSGLQATRGASRRRDDVRSSCSGGDRARRGREGPARVPRADEDGDGDARRRLRARLRARPRRTAPWPSGSRAPCSPATRSCATTIRREPGDDRGDAGRPRDRRARRHPAVPARPLPRRHRLRQPARRLRRGRRRAAAGAGRPRGRGAPAAAGSSTSSATPAARPSASSPRRSAARDPVLHRETGELAVHAGLLGRRARARRSATATCSICATLLRAVGYSPLPSACSSGPGR